MLTGLTELRLTNCPNVTTEGLRAIKTLTSLSALNLSFSPSLATAGLRAVSSLSTLTHLHLTECRTLTRTSDNQRSFCLFYAHPRVRDVKGYPTSYRTPQSTHGWRRYGRLNIFVACRACGAPGGLVAHGRHGMGATGGACPDKPPLASCHPRTATLRASAYFPTTSVSHVDGRGRVDPLSSRGVCVGSKGISHAPSCSTLRTRTAPASLVARRVPFARCETAHFDSGRGDVRSLFGSFTHTHACTTSRAIQRAIVRHAHPHSLILTRTCR